MHIAKNAFRYMRLVLLIYVSLHATYSHAIRDKAQWDTEFQSRYQNSDPILDVTNANENGIFSWHAHYWIRAYVSMAQAYGEMTYLDKAVQLIDYILNNRDRGRYDRGELDLGNEPYVSAPLYYLNHRDEAAPGWRILVFDSEWRIQTLDDGQITHAIMRFVDLVLSSNVFSGYIEKANEYIKKVEEIVNTHDSLFAYNRFENVPGSYYYPNMNGDNLYSGDVPFNHNATMGVSLLLLDKLKGGSTGYFQKAKAILNYFKHHVRLINNNAYDWDYHFRNPGVGLTETGDEDFNHAHLDISFLILAYQRGLNLNADDMQRLTNTLTKNIYLGDGELAWSVDGTETNPDRQYWSVGYDWIDLAQFDPKVLDIAKEVYMKHYASPTWARPFLGWANILRWSIVSDRRVPAAPTNAAVGESSSP